MRLSLIVACVGLFATQSYANDFPLAAQQLYEKAKHGQRYELAMKLSPAIVPTADGRSFFVIWRPKSGAMPRKWVVSLHGSHGFATEDFAVWSPYLMDRDVGYIGLQWWLGQGHDDYYKPQEIYRELDVLMSRLQISPGDALLEGFSRGAANIYAVAALDHVKGRNYFSLFVASSGGVSVDYPPTQQIERGVFGAQPYAGSNWITACGGTDENPNRDGCPAMQRTAQWLKGKGANIVMQLEDANLGHGAFHRNPALANKALDWFMK